MVFDKLSKADQDVLVSVNQTLSKKLIAQVRKDNKAARLDWGQFTSDLRDPIPVIQF